MVLLAVIGLEKEPYGRAVLRAVQFSLGGEQSISAGAVYATLDRLEVKSLLSSRIEEGTLVRGGRARRFYLLASAGASALNEAQRTLDGMWRGKRWSLEGCA
jgi:PadR family transcriptional regulator, regulatory protein PadR